MRSLGRYLLVTVMIVTSLVTLWSQFHLMKHTQGHEEVAPLPHALRRSHSDNLRHRNDDTHNRSDSRRHDSSPEEDLPLLLLRDESERALRYEEAWWMEDTPDFAGHEADYSLQNIYHSNQRNSHHQHKIHPYQIPLIANSSMPTINFTNTHPTLAGLRLLHDPQLRQQGNPLCHRYRFNLSNFPTMSAIITVQNERPGMLAFSIHSLLARTPPEILKEIIIVDDNGMRLPEERTSIDPDEWKHLETISPKVRIIHHAEKQGCAGSRLTGARNATGDVLFFGDSHIEMYTSTWAQHLLLPILQNPRTLSMQSLHILDDLEGYNRKPVGTHNSYGTIDRKFIFGYQTGRFGKEYPTARLPYEFVFAPGSLFAIRRDEFWRLGGYDTGLGVWGGENTGKCEHIAISP